MRYDLLAARILVTAVLVAGAVFGLRWTWLQYEVEPWTRDGRLRADIVQITPDVSGLVTSVLVRDNEVVKKGQVLLVLDQPRYQYALDQAEAAVAVQKAALAEAEREDRRNHALSQLVAAEVVEQGSAKVDQLRAALNQAVANRNLAQLNLERTTIHAPVDGIVTNMELQPGDYATVGHQAMALVYTGSIRVEGYFEETKLPAIRVGDSARVWLMGADEPIRGHVESISGGIEDRELGASGTMLANVNPTFSWVRLPQRIPVRIALDDVPEHMRLVPGRTATVEIDSSAPPVVRRRFPW
jgi:RND family efflux transporter MFP subunit